MGMHELWFLPLVVQQVLYYLHVLILILCYLVVEYEGLQLYYYYLLMLCLALQMFWLFQCRLLHCVKMVDVVWDFVWDFVK